MTGMNGQARPALLRHLNGRAVLTALQRHGALSRAEIARHTGVSGPTVTRVVTDLLGSGLLEEGDTRPAGLGRPGRVLRLASRAVSVLGLAVGARQCEMVAAGLDGAVRPEHVRTFATPARYGDLVRAAVRHARRLGRETGTTV